MVTTDSVRVEFEINISFLLCFREVYYLVDSLLRVDITSWSLELLGIFLCTNFYAEVQL